MGKYASLKTAIFSHLSGLTWGMENIPTYPQDMTPKTTDEKFVRISIIPGGNGINLNSVSGICIFDIYTSADDPFLWTTIADKLDEYFVGSFKEQTGILQFPLASTVVPKGRDKDNPSFIRHSYTIPFVYFGVQ